MKKLFIDKEINVTEGHFAESKIQEKNDSKYIQNDSILKVDLERWQDAQHYEKKTWMQQCLYFSDDRNYEHFSKFEGYNTLSSNNTSIKRIIELGCGPFTNIRTLENVLTNVEEVHLLDPLLNDYLSHPNCHYKSGKLLNFKTTLHSLPIEQFNTDLKYDLVLMNNVLEHCYDVTIIFDKIYSLLRDGGIFVFSDVYFLKQDVHRMVYEIYDAGHPIKLSEEYMNEFLSKFETLYQKDFHKLYDQDWRHDKYFIGRKI
jgi:SAM-dependent methyltransferase